MLIITENGLYKFNRFDAVKLVEVENGCRLTLIKYFEDNPVYVVIGEYTSYKKALQAFNTITNKIIDDEGETGESILSLDTKTHDNPGTEEIPSSKQFILKDNTHHVFLSISEFQCITFGNDGEILAYKKDGGKVEFQHMKGVAFI